jgi:hypothetical protein
MQDKMIGSSPVGECEHVDQAANSKVRVGPRSQRHKQPEIHVYKQDGRVTSILITCACGEQVTVLCDYEEPGQ